MIDATFAATYDTLDRVLHDRNYAVIMVDLVDTKQGNSSCDLADMVRYLSNVQPTAKIIGMSSIPTWYQARDAFQAGMHNYVPKSATLCELITAVQQVLHSSTSEHQSSTGDGV